jgi:DNA-binding MarR family transcriptional regulator
MPAAPRDRPDIAVFDEIGVIAHLLRETISRRLPPGMAYAHFELLLHFVRDGDGQTPAQLARAMMVTKGAITNTLQRMEAVGHVAVLADVSDGRKKRVRITRVGIEAYNDVLKALRGERVAMRSAFTDDEFREVLPFLKALRAFLEEGDLPVGLSALPR